MKLTVYSPTRDMGSSNRLARIEFEGEDNTTMSSPQVQPNEQLFDMYRTCVVHEWGIHCGLEFALEVRDGTHLLFEVVENHPGDCQLGIHVTQPVAGATTYVRYDLRNDRFDENVK